MKKKLTFSIAAAIGFCCAVLSGCVFQSGAARCAPPTYSGYKWVLGCIESNYLYYDTLDLSGVPDGDIDALTAKLDVYSAYYDPEEYKTLMSEMAGNYVGIGVSSTFEEGAGELVVSVTGNSPAYAAGIKRGEYLTGGVYGGTTYTFSASSGLTEMVKSIPVGETFTLSGEHGEYELARAAYVASYSYMATNSGCWIFSGDGFETPVEKADLKLGFLPDGYAYLNISRFYGDLGSETGKLLAAFSAEGCTDLIIDLRNNGGGYLNVLQEVAGCFGPTECAVMTAKYRNGATESHYPTAPKSQACRLPAGTRLYALANVDTASASEAFLGYLISCGLLKYENIYLSDYPDRDDDCRTFGKGIMQTTFKNNSSGEGLRLTTANIFWANGESIHGTGLTKADGCKTISALKKVTYGDEELQAAVAAISG